MLFFTRATCEVGFALLLGQSLWTTEELLLKKCDRYNSQAGIQESLLIS
jgi:hypothetical protein